MKRILLHFICMIFLSGMVYTNQLRDISKVGPKTEVIDINNYSKIFYVDQNYDSGNWVIIGRSFIPANVTVELKVIDSGENTLNAVLRADAVMFSIIKEVTNVNNFDNGTLPKRLALAQNYPNPFNPSTTISYSLPKDGYVALKVYDILGRVVETLVNNFR